MSTKLSRPTFDVFQDNNIRRSDEAKSIYIASNVKHILDNPDYFLEFDSVLSGYDFEKLYNPNGLSFSSLVSKWSQANSIIINIIISASKYVLVEHKKDEQSFIQNSLPDIEATAIANINADLRSIMFEYTNKGAILWNENVKTLSKIDLLQAISKCELEKLRVSEKNSYSTLWKITKLNSEYLGLSNRKSLKISAMNMINKECNGSDIDDDTLNSLFIKCKRG